MKKTAPYAPVDPAPLRAAIAKADKAKADVVELEQSAAKWKQEHADFQKVADPHNEDHLRILGHAREKFEIVPNFIRKYEREIGPAMNALLRAMRAFDKQFLAAALAEREALLDEIAESLAPVIKGYCRPVEMLTADQRIELSNPARSLAGNCNVLGEIPTTPETLAGGYEPMYAHSFLAPDMLQWPETPGLDDLSAQAVHAGFNPDGSAPSSLDDPDELGGYDPATQAARIATRQAAGVPRRAMPGEVFRINSLHLANARTLAQARQVEWERTVRTRAAALLARYDAWKANGGQFVPANFAELGPVKLDRTALAAPVVAGNHVPGSLGGAPKPSRLPFLGSLGGAPKASLVPKVDPTSVELASGAPAAEAAAPTSGGAPGVDLQNFKL